MSIKKITLSPECEEDFKLLFSLNFTNDTPDYSVAMGIWKLSNGRYVENPVINPETGVVVGKFEELPPPIVALYLLKDENIDKE